MQKLRDGKGDMERMQMGEPGRSSDREKKRQECFIENGQSKGKRKTKERRLK